MASLKEKNKKEIIPALCKEHQYKNIMQAGPCDVCMGSGHKKEPITHTQGNQTLLEPKTPLQSGLLDPSNDYPLGDTGFF